MVDVSEPIRIGKTKPIKDKRWLGEKISLKDVISKSSNVGSAARVISFLSLFSKEFLESFGFLKERQIELPEANVRSSIGSDPWTKYKAAMIAIGHGISISPLHLANAYATAVNGGYRIFPTIIKDKNKNNEKIRVISEEYFR